MDQQQRRKLEQENLDRLDRMIGTANETTQISNQIETNLHQQTEQIHRIDDSTRQTESNLGKSKKLVRGMKGFFGRVKNWFHKDKSHKHRQPERNPPPPPPPQQVPQPVDPPKTVTGGVRKYEGSQKDFISARGSEEENKKLDELNFAVEGLKFSAQRIGDTLDYHNNLLDDINARTDKNIATTSKLNNDIERIVR